MFCTIFVKITVWKMNRILYISVLILSLFLFSSADIHAQEKIGECIEIDKTVHNFGDILLDSGPVSCTFTVKNIGTKPLVIYNALTTCGCTKAEWTKEPIMPGKTGTISAKYTNDEGPYPFDKTITVYFSEPKKPVILKMRGVCMEKRIPLDQAYTIKYGPLGLRESYIKCGNMQQGGRKCGSATVANLSGKPVDVRFGDVSDFLEISVSPNPVPPGKTAEMSFCVTADRSRWGKNYYWATPVIDGKTYRNADGSSRIGIWAITKENFDDMSSDEKTKAARPQFESSTHTFGKVKRGEVIHAEFKFKNVGQSCFKVYKVDVDTEKWSHSDIPAAKPGEEVKFRVHLDTAGLPAGETLAIVTLTTNSPLRPIVNLFITGWLE